MVSNHIMLTDSVVNFGKLFLNTPYHYGSPGISSFDCSGFTSHVYRNFGYTLGRSSSDQAKQFDSIDRTQLKAGDLVFFSGSRRSKRVGHVGIVTNAKENGEFDFIHAAVHSGVTISNSNEEYYTRRFVKASRVIGTNQLLAISKFVSNDHRQNKDTLRFTPQISPFRTINKNIPAEYHHVKSGETLSSISKKYGMSVAELKRKNNIKGNKLSLKQSLMVKDEETVLVAQTVESAENKTNSPEVNNSSKTLSSKTEVNLASNQSDNLHSVKKGETLFSIANSYHISVEELKKINNLSKGRIKPGQQLQIHPITDPVRNETFASAKEVLKPMNHKVVSGESLFSISKSVGIPVDELKRINHITTGNIHPGQELKLTQEKEINSKNEFASKTDKKQDSKIENAEKVFTHKIKKGENLGTIAKENNTTVDELKRINNLADSKIHVGQELKIIPTTVLKNNSNLAERTDKKSEVRSDSKEISLTHKIKKGENLGAIAKEHNTTVDELKRINNLADSKIHEGQELKIVQSDASKNNRNLTEKMDIKKDFQSEGKENVLSHKIKNGESLISIAKSNNISVDELKRMNHLSDSKIKSGQELRISETAVRSDRSNSKSDNETKSIQHKVKSGESFYTIAKLYGCTVEELKDWNSKSGSKIKAGEKIVIFQKSNKKDLSLVE